MTMPNSKTWTQERDKEAINYSKHCGVITHEAERKNAFSAGSDWAHTRLMQDVAPLVEACLRRMKSDEFCELPYDEDMGAALAKFKQAQEMK